MNSGRSFTFAINSQNNPANATLDTAYTVSVRGPGNENFGSRNEYDANRIAGGISHCQPPAPHDAYNTSAAAISALACSVVNERYSATPISSTAAAMKR